VEEAPDEQRIAFADALRPFDGEEHNRLARYLQRVDKLTASRFFESEGKITVSFKREEGWRTDTTYVDDEEAIDAMLQRLRILYAPGRETAASYPRTTALLRAHILPTVEGGRLTDALNEYDKIQKSILDEPDESHIGLAMVTTDEHGDEVARRVITPGEAFLDWLYGEHIHDDEDRLARIEPWRELGLHRHVALNTAIALTRLYNYFGIRVVRRR
jgi:hypothetical protein